MYNILFLYVYNLKKQKKNIYIIVNIVFLDYHTSASDYYLSSLKSYDVSKEFGNLS